MNLLVSPLRSSSSDSKKGSQSSVKSSRENTGSTSDSVGKSFCLCAAFLGILLEDGWVAECIGNLWETVWVSMWTWFTGWLSVSFGTAGSSERSKHIFTREHTDDIGVSVQGMSENYGILSKKGLDRSKIVYSTFNLGFRWKLMKLNQKNNRLNWSAIISLVNQWWPVWWKEKNNDKMASSLSISMTQENTTHLQTGRGTGLVQEGGGVEFVMLFIL